MNRILVPLPECTADSCGGKAAGLARLIALGVPVPSGLCLTADAYRRALPTTLPRADLRPSEVPSACAAVIAQLERWAPDDAQAEALAQGVARLGTPLAARSSASCEDRERHSSAGVFESVLDVSTIDALIGGIRRCWISLWQVPAWVTLQARGRWPGAEEMSVIVQRQVPASRGGLALSRAPTDATSILVESANGRPSSLAQGDIDPHRMLVPRRGAIATPTRQLLGEAAIHELRQHIGAIESAFGQVVEVEWLIDHLGQVWIVQARPDPGQAALSESCPSLQPSDRQVWRWDREHNPEPLSPAHASLIAQLDEQLADLVRLRVHEGYLFEATEPHAAEDSSDASVAELDFEGELERLRGFLDDAAQEQLNDLSRRLTRAIERFIGFNRQYIGGLGRARRIATAHLRAFLEHHASESDTERIAANLSRGMRHESWQRAEALHQIGQRVAHDAGLRQWLDSDSERAPYPAALGPFLERYGCLATSWDIATPTFAERPTLLKQLIRATVQAGEPPLARVRRSQQAVDRVAQQLADQLDPSARAELFTRVDRARRARELAEDDDVLFARALWPIRSALLACAEQLHHCGALESPEQIFGLSIGLVEQAMRSDTPSGTATLVERAQEGLTSWRQQRQRVPPLVIRAGRPSWARAPTGRLLRGIGIGGVACARARLIRRPEQLLEEELRDLIVVCPTLTPALAVVIPHVAGIVTDHGGLLSHAACLAREYDLPAVVGAGSATRLVSDGDWLWVDGPRGIAVRLDESAALTRRNRHLVTHPG
jgi:phosphohistidine swiveling domain-containing protein